MGVPTLQMFFLILDQQQQQQQHKLFSFSCRYFNFNCMMSNWSNEFTCQARCEESDALGDDKEVSDTRSIQKFVLDKFMSQERPCQKLGTSEAKFWEPLGVIYDCPTLNWDKIPSTGKSLL